MKNKRYIINAMGMHSTKYGGLEKFIVLLAKELSKVNICLIVIYNSEPHSKDFVHDLNNSGGKLVISHALHPLRYFSDLFLLFKHYKPELVHIHFQPRYSVIFAKLLRSKNIFITMHLLLVNRDYTYISDIKQIPFRTRINTYMINEFTDRIFAVSEACKFQYITLFPDVKKKVDRFYLGTLPNQSMAPVVRDKFCLKSGEVVIGLISFNAPIKGLDILMDAMVLLKDSFRCSNFVVVQCGIDSQAPENESLIAECKQKGLNSNFRWMGIRNDIDEIAPGFDIYCQPSRSEALSLSIVEAGMAGVPIVGSRIGGIPEVVQEGFNGLLFETGNSFQLAECLHKLIIDKDLRARMGNNSRELMLSRFNILNQTKAMFYRYLEAVGQ